MSKAVSSLMGKPMTSASHVATGATRATNVVVDTVPHKQVPARMALTSSQDQQMHPNLVQVQHTAESEQSDLSDDEFSVLEVQLTQSGEFSKGSPSSAGSHTLNMSNNVRGRLKERIAFWERIEAPSFILDTIREGTKFPSSLNHRALLSRTTIQPNHMASL